MSTLVLACVLSLCLVASGSAGPFEDGYAAYGRGEYARAAPLFQEAAENGNADAQMLLGKMYANGEGVQKDDTESLKWYYKAAEQGNADAQSLISAVYGQLAKDYSNAAVWLVKAAEQGHASAQYRMGLAYSTGRCVPQDYVEAHMWLNLAAAQGDKGAEEFRALLARIMTPDQIAEAQRLAREWVPKK